MTPYWFVNKPKFMLN